MAEEKKNRGSLLGVVAYVLVPGERRVRASRHFRKAGLEALKGVGELVRPQGQPEASKPADRQRIEIE